jgi:hypothetical protein
MIKSNQVKWNNDTYITFHSAIRIRLQYFMLLRNTLRVCVAGLDVSDKPERRLIMEKEKIITFKTEGRKSVSAEDEFLSKADILYELN